MGNGSSHPQPVATTAVDDVELRLAPHNFYLIFGKPSIHFSRDRVRGPLLYDVAVEYDDDENVVEHAATLDLSCAVPRRQKIELVGMPAPPSGTIGSSKGLALAFRMAATHPPQRVRVYAGVSVDYRAGDGVRLRTSGGVAAGSVCILDTTETAGLTAVVTNPLVLPQLLQPLKYEDVARAGTLATTQRVSYAPLAIEVIVGETEDPIKKPKRAAPADKDTPVPTPPHPQSPTTSLSPALPPSPPPPQLQQLAKKRVVQYTFLEAPVEAPVESPGSPRGGGGGGGDARPIPRFTCKVAKQLLQVGCEVYDLEDVFDDGREEDVRHTRAAAAAADEDEDEEEEEEGLCVICLTNRKDTTILPCRHMCLCNECAAHLRLSNNRCPLCRGNIDRVMTL
ncbi:Zinc finger, C3HC4 type (RING finger) containing protein [Novymonas esmeraldas]|uniref:Zinc finger, C3HC4 type (RING finger) containing protein n=1 Tax=Novymonas esmeraldas TaxID=1808958 RepID=A0AAW0EN21_9TRYP